MRVKAVWARDVGARRFSGRAFCNEDARMPARGSVGRTPAWSGSGVGRGGFGDFDFLSVRKTADVDLGSGTMNDKSLRVLASIGLGVGGALGIAGTFAPSASLRGLAWGIDGIALVMACPLLTLRFFKMGQEIVAAGFLVFAIGESLLVFG